jgi:hypothetical protein
MVTKTGLYSLSKPFLSSVCVSGCEAASFSGYCGARKKGQGTEQTTSSGSSLFSLRVRPAYCVDVPWIATSLWLIPRFLGENGFCQFFSFYGDVDFWKSFL